MGVEKFKKQISTIIIICVILNVLNLDKRSNVSTLMFMNLNILVSTIITCEKCCLNGNPGRE